MATLEVELLIEQQAVNLTTITRAITNARKLPAERRTIPVFQGRLDNLKTEWADFKKNHAILCQMVEKKNRREEYFTKDIFQVAEGAYQESLDYLNQKIAALEPAFQEVQPTRIQGQQSTSGQQSTVKLPRIEVPSFSGKYEDWDNFHDLFDSLVVKNESLDNVQKLHYLKFCMSGEAAALLKNFQVTATNYTAAWAAVKARYNNKRAIINAHLHNFFSIPSVVTDSIVGLKTLRDVTFETQTALKNIGQTVEQWDTLIVYCIVQKLDKQSRREWETGLGSTTEYPDFKRLETFLDTRIRTLEALGSTFRSNEYSKVTSNSKYTGKSSQSVKAHLASSQVSCYMCLQEHAIYACPSFKDLNVEQRENFVRKSNLCTNCLTKGHIEKECKSKYNCPKCQQRHHTLLHRNSKSGMSQALQVNSHVESNETPTASEAEDSDESTPEPNSNDANVHLNLKIKNKPRVLLATACVILQSNSGHCIKVRALLDQGSDATFVSERVSQALRLPRKRTQTAIHGLGGNSLGAVNSVVEMLMRPCHEQEPVIHVQALVLQKITSYKPQEILPFEKYEHLANVRLEESNTLEDDSIDLLIGADYYGQILREGLRKGPLGTPTAQLTIFGWVISGPLSRQANFSTSLHTHFAESEQHDTLAAFWKIEEMPNVKFMTDDERDCDKHFEQTHSKKDKRYVVRLPFKTKPPLIGDTKTVAKASLASLQKKLTAQPILAVAYRDFLQEYEQLGHMELTHFHQPGQESRVFLPHHPVVRDDSITTKVRVVFNASCRSSNGTSLNDHLHVGPKLQSDLPYIILNWRVYPFVYTADTAKMFRQILVDPRDQHYQCILWTSATTNEVVAYKLLTLTYGMAPSPYLALRVIKQLVEDEGDKFPLAIPVLSEKIFVDEIMFGANTTEEIHEIRKQVTSLLAEGGFTLRKWASNAAELLDDISPEDHGLALERPLQEEEGLKILGILWNPTDDSFRIKITLKECPHLTKRTLLSAIAKIFDPLGWVCPVVIVAKILIQSLWLLKSDWDDELPSDITASWKMFCEQLPMLEQVRIPRWTEQDDSLTTCELHGFADASTKAYAAVIYLRIVRRSGRPHTTLLMSKSKVAPLKTLSVPRLELCAAVLLARLTNYVQETMKLKTIPTICWTDSMVALGWIRKPPYTWKVFVANRVADIHTLIPNATWRHVPTSQNPADCASRGICPEEFLKHSLWQQGPPWLLQSSEAWPDQKLLLTLETKNEIKTVAQTHAVQTDDVWDLANRYSSWAKLLRITGLVLRFVKHVRLHIRQRLTGPINTDATNTTPQLSERQLAVNFWAKILQQNAFPKEYKALKTKRPLPTKSPLIKLDPFFDSKDDLIRVGGRLRHSELSYSRKHPIVFPQHSISNLIIAQVHANTLHGGVQLTLRVLREVYWVLNARALVKSHIHKCVKCTRYSAPNRCQLLADLPTVRSTQSRPFSHTGVDYAGPVMTRLAPGRGHKAQKAYIAVFVCLATRAIHIELVNDCTSTAFLAAFDRFASRRGIPSDMYSDNATTFKGADKELISAFKLAVDSPELTNRLENDGTKWHYIPPNAPHFGGLWEAGVKSVKHHMRRILGTVTPTAEELMTLLCQIEACLNSRPIAPLKDDVDSFDALTPGHFLIGTALKTVPQPSLLELNENRLSRWQLMRLLLERFWRLWSNEYLHSLQQRQKWTVRQENLKPGDMVLIKNVNLAPGLWELGRVEKCHPGKDNLIRVVTVRTANSTYVRPITQLCVLPIDHTTETAS